MTSSNLSALEYELVAPDQSRPTKELVDVVVQLFLAPIHFDRAVILRSPFLRNRAMLRVLGDHPFQITSDRTVVDVADWIRSCHSQGHLSVWFVPKECEHLERALRKVAPLNQHRLVRIGGSDLTGPLGTGQQASLQALIDSGDLRGADIAFTLSHDGEQLYRVALDGPLHSD